MNLNWCQNNCIIGTPFFSGFTARKYFVNIQLLTSAFTGYLMTITGVTCGLCYMQTHGQHVPYYMYIQTSLHSAINSIITLDIKLNSCTYKTHWNNQVLCGKYSQDFIIKDGSYFIHLNTVYI